MLKDPFLHDDDSFLAKQFRRRFRIPFRFFNEWLVPQCEENNIFGLKRKADGSVFGIIPLEIKILIALRILGRGNCCDDLNEFTQVGESTCNNYFKQFVKAFSARFKEKFISPAKGDDLKQVIEVYSRHGFPGACGSMDCTHIPRRMCPVELTNLCTGKEGYPTLSFQCLVDHSRKIRHVSKSFFGAMNDKNICEVDSFIISEGPNSLLNINGQRNLYREVEFILLDVNGM